MQNYHLHNGKICVDKHVLIQHGILNVIPHKTKSLCCPVWDKWVQLYKHGLVQKGGNGRVALFDYNVIPGIYREAVKLKLGDPREEKWELTKVIMVVILRSILLSF